LSHQVEVIVRRAGHPERRMMLSPGVTLLGRAEDNDLVLTDIGVSRRHARILVHEKGTYIEDMGSGNGTYFRGRRVQRQQIEDADEVLVDPFLLRFRVHRLDTKDDGVTAELEDVDDDDTVRVSEPGFAPPTEERPLMLGRSRLVTLTGQRLEAAYEVGEGGLSMGRSEARDIVLFDPAASRNHADIERLGTDYWLRDHGSANGTFVNATRVREQCLRNGDKVRIGSTEFRFELQNPEPGAAVRAMVLDAPTRKPPPSAYSLGQLPTGPQAKVRSPHAEVGQPSAPPPRLPSHRPPVSGLQMAIFAGLAGFVLVAMLIAGAVITMSVLDERGGFGSHSSEVLSEKRAPILDPATAQRVGQLLERGMVHYDAGRFLDAAAQYLSVLTLSEGHSVAQRMGYRACEQLLISRMRRGLVLRNLPADERLARRTAALKMGRQALKGRGDLARAAKRLRAVVVFMPDDKEVRALLAETELAAASPE
jgi:pSer/pThr/pTyr-binding forkhead associated (FHA) protein